MIWFPLKSAPLKEVVEVQCREGGKIHLMFRDDLGNWCRAQSRRYATMKPIHWRPKGTIEDEEIH
jgi:hypothetical protein